MNSIPDLDCVDDKWKFLLPPVYEKVLKKPFLFTRNNDGQWIQHGDALFNVFKSYAEGTTDVQKSVLALAKMYNKNLVEVSAHVWNMIQTYVPSVQCITPKYIRSLLHCSSQYTQMTHKDKLNILQFILEDGVYSDLLGLELLPLQNGSFVKFDNRNNQNGIFLSSQDDFNMFPGLDDKFLLLDLPQSVQQHFQKIVQKGMFQLHQFGTSNFVNLLLLTIERKYGTTSSPVPLPEGINERWLSAIWHYIKENFPYSLDTFKNVPILPVKAHHGHSISLYKLSGLFIVKCYAGMPDLSDDVCTCLQHLSMIVIQSLPQYVMEYQPITQSLVKFPTIEGVLSLLSELHSSSYGHAVSRFNDYTSEREKSIFLNFLGNTSSVNNKAKSLLCQLQIFHEGSSEGVSVSINEVQLLAPTEKLPVPYPRKLIDCSEQKQRHFAKLLGEQKQRNFAKLLGAAELDINNLVGEILGHLANGTVYSHSDKQSFMIYFMTNMYMFETNRTLLQTAKLVSFVPTLDGKELKPNDVFDSNDSILTKIFPDGNKFPYGDDYGSASGLRFLQKLGLKSSDDLTPGDILECVKHLHEKSQGNCQEKDREQSIAVMKILQNRPHLLSQKVNGYQTLATALKDLNFILAKKAPSDYPKVMNWYQDQYFCKPSEMFIGIHYRLVGSVASLLPDDISQDLTNHLQCAKYPPVAKVLEQLDKVINKYEDHYKPELLPLIKDIYKYLARSGDVHFDVLKKKKIAWIGNGFCQPCMMYVTTRSSDISLKPYLFPLPSEFQDIPNIKLFFKKMDSKDHQDSDSLIHVQHVIRDKHMQNYEIPDVDVRQDLTIIIKILNQLKQNPESVKNYSQPLLFPVHSFDNQLILKPTDECRYSNAEWLKDLSEAEGEGLFFIHPDIPQDTAMILGVPSLTDDLLSDAEGFEQWGQTEPLTRRLKNILKDYTDGFSVPKEIVQNADDAGATKVCFMYDERENNDARTRLLDENMSSCQGPALWAYNDAVFTREDLANITKLSGATKEEDLKKIGKFGLGFCSVYNLTDVPSFITGNHIVIFDPHAKYLGKAISKSNPGLKIDLKSIKNQIMVRRLKNQFKPFNGIFGCDLTVTDRISEFNGTLFRFPLRTPAQAAESEISQKPYPREEMESLLSMFMSAAGNILLFTQNVAEIELYHLSANAESPDDAKLVYNVKREIHNQIVKSDSGIAMDILCTELPQTTQISVVKNYSEAVDSLRRGKIRSVEKIDLCMQVDISVKVKPGGQCLGQCPKNVHTKWFIAWASGTGTSSSIMCQMQVKKALSLASVAVLIWRNEHKIKLIPLSEAPFGFYNKSHFFCYLPLPVECHLPVHINGSFAVTANRKQLCCKTIDDKESFENKWNEALMSDAVCNAYLLLLERFKEFDFELQEVYYKLWPIPKDRFKGNLLALQKSFYQKIVQDNPVIFRRDNSWEPFENCIFLDPSLMSSQVGPEVFRAAVHFKEKRNLTVMELPPLLLKCFEEAGCLQRLKERIMTVDRFYEDIFFPNIEADYWIDKEDIRNQIVYHALIHSTPAVACILKNTACIPSKPNGTLKRPSELIHPLRSARMLFDIEEERFIEDIGKGYFVKDHVLSILTTLGLIQDDLQDDVLLGRVKSVGTLVQRCTQCGLERCGNLLNYLSKYVDSPEKLQTIAQIEFLPVEKKPCNWLFPWGGETPLSQDLSNVECDNPKHRSSSMPLVLEKPAAMYESESKNLVGCMQRIFDKKLLQNMNFSATHRLLSKLGIKRTNEIPVQVVIEQLICLCKTQTSHLDESVLSLLADICRDIYKFFDTKLTTVSDGQRENLIRSVKELKSYPVILFTDTFVKPELVALNLPVDCRPCLFGINDNILRHRKNVLKVLDVKDEFQAGEVLDVILSEQRNFNDMKLLSENVDLFCRLLGVLCKAAAKEKMIAKDIKDICKNKLLVPDENCFLRPIDDLCMDDSGHIRRSKTMIFAHEKISLEIANALGIRSKKRGQLKDHTRKLAFGQKEELTKRIARILSGYPCDEGIFKELLQNADDAGASEIHFIKDFRHHSTIKVFHEMWNPLQGPALLVYNDSAFTESDIEGIQKLGTGSKGDDPTKTGQYGVGFNAVYHLTDAPSFLTKGPEIHTGETLCVLDPNCLYDPDTDKESPGFQYYELDDLKESYPDVFECYNENQLLREKGTIFRLPLRNYSMAKVSEIKKDAISKEMVSNLLEKFKEEMFQALLFVKNVKTITVSDITTGKLVKEYNVHVRISEEDEIRRKEFTEYVKEVSFQLSRTHGLLDFNEREFSCTVSISDSTGVTQSWLVVQRIGIVKEEVEEEVLNAYRSGDIGMLPLGGMALPLSFPKKKRTSYTAFCFLPLPNLTGLPVHINGHFDLDHETRRTLWHNEKKKDYRNLWNEMLIRNVITPAFIRGIQSFKDMLGLENGKTFEKNCLKSQLEKFHASFPDIDKASHHYWKYLVKCFYRQLVQNEEEVFVKFHESKKSDDQEYTQVNIYPLVSANDTFPAVFDNLRDQLIIENKQSSQKLAPSEREHNKADILRRTCKSLGMKLLDSPIKLQKNLIKAGIDKASFITPEYLIEFLKSFNRKDIFDKCILEGLGREVADSTFHNMSNVIECILYCKKANTFQAQIEGLPLCITNDCILRSFTMQNPVFCTQYCDLLPESSESFLHRNIVQFFNEKQDEYVGIFKLFDIESLVSYLPLTLSPEKFKTQTLSAVSWDLNSVPASDWIKRLWQFLFGQLIPEIEKIKDLHQKGNKMLQILHNLSSWCLLPCVTKEPKLVIFRTDKRQLVPLCSHERIILNGSFTGHMERALSKMNFPEIDKGILGDEPYKMLTTNLIASQAKPFEVLKCLYHHRQEIADNNNLTTDDCISVLEYLSENLEKILTSADPEDVKEQIKHLRFHITVQGSRTDLVNQWDVLILPPGIPTEGIEEWGESSNILLLKHDDKLKPIYDFLEYTESSLCDVYTNHIFQTFDYLSKSHQEIHLKYVRDVLLKKSSKYSPEQNKVITALKSLAFVWLVDGSVVTATQFYSPFHDLFKVMKNFVTFPPKPFCEYSWKKFMNLAGIKNSVTHDMFIDFAKQIERDGVKADTEMKSQTLMEHLFTMEDIAQIDLNVIAGIRFLPPYKVNSFMESIHKQFNSDRLICISGSVVSKQCRLVWTNCDLLPMWADPFSYGLKKNVCTRFNAIREPDFDTVLKHIQNICDSMKIKLTTSEMEHLNQHDIQDLMKYLYEYLQTNGIRMETKLNLQQKLKLKPIIYLPAYRTFVTCERAVKELDEKDVIKPYLYPLPDEFVPFYKLFELLGTNRKPTIGNYAKILENMYIDIGGKEMHANELKLARNAVYKLFHLLMEVEGSPEEIDMTVKTLYFPSRSKVLADTANMLYSDMTTMENIVKNERDLVFFLGFREMEIHFPDGGSYMKYLPEKYRPKLLSQLIKRSVNTASLELINGEKADKLQAFILSQEFIESIFRLISDETRKAKYFYQSSKRQKLEIDQKKILSQIQSITIAQVVDLEMTSTFRKVVVDRTKIYCWYEKVEKSASEEWIFYFSEDTNDWIQKVENSFSRMLDKCTGYLLGSNRSYIFKILSYICDPCKIKKLLDDDHIAEYAMTSASVESVFPIPGTIVNQKWHFLLDNSFTEFDIGDYVALQLADEDSEDQDVSGQVFMYAVIREKLQMVGEFPVSIAIFLQTYRVDVGGGRCEVIPAYRVYKFFRDSVSTSTEVECAGHIVYNHSSSESFSRPLEDVFREIRQILKTVWNRSDSEKKYILKRLLRKWHPDKNFGNEEFAKQVFQYIKQCIERLELGEDIDRGNCSNDGSGSRQGHSAYEAWFDDVNRSCTRDRYYQQQSTGHQAGTSSRSSGGYSGHHAFSAQTEATPLPQEAKRWYRQACNDLAAAQKFVDSADDIRAYNWICYICHQAAEKAMKAVWYYNDANRVTKSHELRTIAMGLEGEIKDLAVSLDSLLGNHTHMRYPDIHRMPNIPSDMFDVSTAVRAIEITHNLCEAVYAVLW